ncbi:MAG TPA: hypothetical protein VN721_04860 [Flavipsychrobacter sp.]|nr:hypothetical protein [Flavipsychrobacter sp.]
MKHLYLSAKALLDNGKVSECFTLLEDEYPFLNKITLRDLDEYGIKIADYLILFLHYETYLNYRKQKPLTEYFSIFFYSGLNPTEKFQSLLEFALSFVYANAFEFLIKNEKAADIEYELFEIVKKSSADILPKVTPALITKDKASLESLIDEISRIIFEMLRIASIETSSLIQHFTKTFSLNFSAFNNDTDNINKDDWFKELLLNSMERFNEKMNLTSKNKEENKQ